MKLVQGCRKFVLILRTCDSLNIQEGFWKGLNSGNLDAVFTISLEEERIADTPLVTEYAQIFGPFFFSFIEGTYNLSYQKSWNNGYLASSPGRVRLKPTRPNIYTGRFRSTGRKIFKIRY